MADDAVPEGATCYGIDYLAPRTDPAVLETIDAAARDYVLAVALKMGYEVLVAPLSDACPDNADCVPVQWQMRRSTVWVREFDISITPDKKAHLPTVQDDGGQYRGVCACGGYRSKPFPTKTRARRAVRSHIEAKTNNG